MTRRIRTGRIPKVGPHLTPTLLTGKNKGTGLHCVPDLYEGQTLWSVCGIPARALKSRGGPVRVADHHTRVSCRACSVILEGANRLAGKLGVSVRDVLRALYPPDVVGIADQGSSPVDLEG